MSDKTPSSCHDLPLPRDLENKIRDVCAQGYQHYDDGHFKEALRLFYQAWLELPKPQSQWPQATWVLSSIGDCYFRLGQFEQGQESLNSALHCPEGEQSAFIQLRLGQCLFELQQPFLARKHLQEAYSIAGASIFKDEDNKYCLAAKASPPC